MMFAQVDQRGDGSWHVTGTVSHEPDYVLPVTRRLVPLTDGVTLTGGQVYVPAGGAVGNLFTGGTFLAPPKSRRIPKTAFLGVLPPALYKAWATSADATLMYAKALFDADITVDLDSPAIAAVFTQAVALALIDAPTAAQLQAAIAALAV